MIRSVLLVDDEPDLRRIAQFSLERIGGFEVRLATSGDEAVELLRQAPSDVVLLDAMMPRCDGPMTLERIRGIPTAQQTPVIFLTARVHQQHIDEYLALGAVGVISKPFDPLQLASEVRRLVETPIPAGAP